LNDSAANAVSGGAAVDRRRFSRFPIFGDMFSFFSENSVQSEERFDCEDDNWECEKKQIGNLPSHLGIIKLISL
jgi:hypothetical protein